MLFVVEHLVKKGIIQEEESTHLDMMLSSGDLSMKALANVILLEKWRKVYPDTSITEESIIFKNDSKGTNDNTKTEKFTEEENKGNSKIMG